MAKSHFKDPDMAVLKAQRNGYHMSLSRESGGSRLCSEWHRFYQQQLPASKTVKGLLFWRLPEKQNDAVWVSSMIGIPVPIHIEWIVEGLGDQNRDGSGEKAAPQTTALPSVIFRNT